MAPGPRMARTLGSIRSGGASGPSRLAPYGFPRTLCASAASANSTASTNHKASKPSMDRCLARRARGGARRRRRRSLESRPGRASRVKMAAALRARPVPPPRCRPLRPRWPPIGDPRAPEDQCPSGRRTRTRPPPCGAGGGGAGTAAPPSGPGFSAPFPAPRCATGGGLPRPGRRGSGRRSRPGAGQRPGGLPTPPPSAAGRSPQLQQQRDLPGFPVPRQSLPLAPPPTGPPSQVTETR